MRRSLKITLISIGVILVFLLLFWRYLLFLPLFFPQNVTLPSGMYLPAPSVYLSSEVNYDPARPPLDSNISNINIDRKNQQVVFNLKTGDALVILLGKTGHVQGCESQFLMEYFQLPVQELRLGSLILHNPILMVSCEMWARGEKLRPAKMVLREGPLGTEDDFMFGTMCRREDEICMYFGQAYGTLNGTVVDGQTGALLPDANITLENGMGIHEFVGEFSLPLYAGVQMLYRISAPGYPDLAGMISNAYDAKLFIETRLEEGQTIGPGGLFELPVYGQELNFAFPLGSVGITPMPTLTSESFVIPSPTTFSSATPVPH